MTLLRPDGELALRRPSTSTLLTVVILGFLGGCAREGPVCGEGFKRCSLTCADLASDALNCGACGAACGAGELCQGGHCQSSPEASLCGDRSCPPPQSCHHGLCSYDLVAACFNTGQVVGIQGDTDLLGPRARVGAFPQTLGSLSNVLLVADGIDQRLRQARLDDLSLLPGEVRLGASPNHIWVDDPYVYLVNSLGNTLQILLRGASESQPSDCSRAPATPDGGFPGGFNLTTIGQLHLGATSSPQAIAKVDHYLFIPLWGDTGRVAQVDVGNPCAPSLTRMFDLGQLDLRPFDGRRAYARPGRSGKPRCRFLSRRPGHAGEDRPCFG